MNVSVECDNEDCGESFDVDLDYLSKVNRGSAGTNLTSYTYEGSVQCPDCDHHQDVEFFTIEEDETDEIVSINKV